MLNLATRGPSGYNRIRGFLEMTTAAASTLSPGHCLRLSNVDWRTYTRVLRTFADRPGIRVTYDQGEMEIMSPTLAHDDDTWFLGHLVIILTEELDLPLKHGGSTTLRRRLKQRGIEADACFWIANAHRMKGRRRLDLRRDPPPDLAIEVDVTNSSLDRLGIYGALRVPEVWRLDSGVLTFHVLGTNKKYLTASVSRSFPLIAPADLVIFLKRGRRADDVNSVMRRFRAFLRKRLAAQ
jgi:Uma2 family endonuclease